MNRVIWIISLLILVGAGAGLAYWYGAPEVEQVFPADGAGRVPATSELRMAFTRAMQPETVLERFSLEPAVPGDFRWEGSTLIFTPREGWPGRVVVQARLRPGARAAGLLSLGMRAEVAWSFTIRHPVLLYQYPADGPANLYALDPASGENRRLTDYPAGIVEYQATQDGNLAYFTLLASQGGSAIYRLDLERALMEELPPAELVLSCPQASCRSPQPSPQGDFLAYERTAALAAGGTGYPQVWLLPLGEAGPGEAFLASELEHQSYAPAWSTGGWLAFYDSNAQGFVLLNPRTQERRLFLNSTGEAGSWEGEVAFVAPEIFFSTAIGGQVGPEGVAFSHLMRYELRTGTVEDLSVAENLEDTTPVFSPSAEYLAFARKYLDLVRWTPGRQLWLARQSDRQAAPITEEPAYNHYGFAWSPVGEALVYVRFNQTSPTELPEIWWFELASRRRTLLVQGGFAPQWIP
jgi:Tol biopolymer transport system component